MQYSTYYGLGQEKNNTGFLATNNTINSHKYVL